MCRGSFYVKKKLTSLKEVRETFFPSTPSTLVVGERKNQPIRASHIAMSGMFACIIISPHGMPMKKPRLHRFSCKQSSG